MKPTNAGAAGKTCPKPSTTKQISTSSTLTELLLAQQEQYYKDLLMASYTNLKVKKITKNQWINQMVNAQIHGHKIPANFIKYKKRKKSGMSQLEKRFNQKLELMDKGEISPEEFMKATGICEDAVKRRLWEKNWINSEGGRPKNRIWKNCKFIGDDLSLPV
jgi:hypothetical protein